MHSRSRILFVLLSLVMSSVAFAQGGGEIPRTASGRPDLSGTYDVATLTPLERPAEYGDPVGPDGGGGGHPGTRGASRGRPGPVQYSGQLERATQRPEPRSAAGGR